MAGRPPAWRIAKPADQRFSSGGRGLRSMRGISDEAH
jgi:hypothetical protein